MTQQAATPNTIRAYVGDVLSIADRLFDASLFTIISELAQNARRSGATDLCISIQEADSKSCLITLEDNGSGLDNPGILLGLRDTEWSDAIDRAEEPAGMGFFVLANCASSFAESKGWRVQLSPEAFKGHTEIQVFQANTPPAGMKVGFLWNESVYETRNKLRHNYGSQDIREFLSRSHMKVTVDGEKLPVEDFLETNYTSAALNRQRVVRDWPDLGVRFSFSVANPDTVTSYTANATAKFNFFGFGGTFDLGANVSPFIHGAKLDILNAMSIKLTLPARNSLQENEALADLRRRIELAVLREHQSAGEHRLPFQLWKRAVDELGLELPEAAPRLSPLNGTGYVAVRTNGDGTLDAALVDYSVDSDWKRMLIFSDAADEVGALYRVSKQLAGYSWYDKLLVINGVSLTVNSQQAFPEYERVDSTWKLPEVGHTELVMHVWHPVTQLRSDIVAGIRLVINPEDTRNSSVSGLAFTVSENLQSCDICEASIFLRDNFLESRDSSCDYEDSAEREISQEILRRLGSVHDAVRMGLEGAADAFRESLSLPSGVKRSDIAYTLTKGFGEYASSKLTWHARGEDKGSANYQLRVRKTFVAEWPVNIGADSLAEAIREAENQAGKMDYDDFAKYGSVIDKRMDTLMVGFVCQPIAPVKEAAE
jgi:hypothetical protein